MASVSAERMPATFRDPSARRVGAVCDYVRAHYRDRNRVTVLQLARVANVSPSYLTREFRRVMRITPHAFVRRVRLAKAIPQLLAGHPLDFVARETGFASGSHLSNVFKLVTGVSAFQYVSGVTTPLQKTEPGSKMSASVQRDDLGRLSRVPGDV